MTLETGIIGAVADGYFNRLIDGICPVGTVNAKRIREQQLFEQKTDTSH
jgi:hypothetical protein